MSNTLYQRLPDTLRAEFQELPPVEAKNIGRIRAWKLGPLAAPSGQRRPDRSAQSAAWRHPVFANTGSTNSALMSMSMRSR